MTRIITKTLVVATLILFCSLLHANAQVSPAAAGTNLFCQDADLILPPAALGQEWIVRYSVTSTTMPSTPVTLSGGTKILAADLKTGYYYLSSKATTAGACESDMQEIPVYVLKPLVVNFTAADFCVESPQTQKGSVTNPEDPTITSLAYQWYTVTGGSETAIAGENRKDYTPATPTVGTKTYRLKVGYVINGNKYCPQTADHDVTVSAKPSKPTITPAQITGTAGAVTF